MIQISRAEADYVRAHAKNSRITVTGSKKKSRNKKHYVDESAETFRLLDRYWSDGRYREKEKQRLGS